MEKFILELIWDLSHKVRNSVARILGLVGLYRVSEAEHSFIINQIDLEITELDNSIMSLTRKFEKYLNMAYRPDCEIQIGNYKLTSVRQVSIESTWREIGDTCKILLPGLAAMIRRSSEAQNVRLEDVIKTGDKVMVLLGYNGDLKVEFVGYVQEIKPSIPFEIKCEDSVYLLKRSDAISKIFNGALSTLLNDVFPDATLGNVPNITLKNFKLDRATKFQILEKLKEAYNLVAYYRGEKLFIGLPYSEANQITNEVLYDFVQNMISDDLTYSRKEDVKLKVKAVSTLQDNTKIEVEVGDGEGEVRTLFFSGITEKSELEKIALVELEKLKYSGYKGKFTSFGVPYAQHGYAAVLTDPDHPEREGVYHVDRVNTEFGVNGFRREIEVGVIL